MNPVIFQLGPFSLTWYGVFLVGGAALATYLSSKYAARAGEKPAHLWSLLAWVLVLGLIGARAYHIFSSTASDGWAYYRQHPIAAINFWNGGLRGLGIDGGLIGGTLGVLLYTWGNRLNSLKFLDFIAPNVPLAQALGRLGNFVNQELYGPPTSVPWAFYINPRYPCQLPPGLPHEIQSCASPNLTQPTLDWYASRGFHPLFFYEAAWNLLIFGLLTLISWRLGHQLRRGDAVLLYLIAYPLGRFGVEFFRPYGWTLGNLATAQWIALGSILIGVVGLFWRHWGWRARDHPQETLTRPQLAQ